VLLAVRFGSRASDPILRLDVASAAAVFGDVVKRRIDRGNESPCGRPCTRLSRGDSRGLKPYGSGPGDVVGVVLAFLRDFEEDILAGAGKRFGRLIDDVGMRRTVLVAS